MKEKSMNLREALQHYADNRKKWLKHVRYNFGTASYNQGTDKEYYSRKVLEVTTWGVRLLDFLVSHLDELPTDEKSKLVLQRDFDELKAIDKVARAYLADPWF